jgi:hypothetical protein
MADNKKKTPQNSGHTQSLQGYLSALRDLLTASQYSAAALSRYTNELLIPYLIATNYFRDVEYTQRPHTSALTMFEDYLGLLNFNMDIWQRSVEGSLDAWRRYFSKEGDPQELLKGSWFNGNLEGFQALAQHKAKLAEMLAYQYPQAIAAIEPEYGFHFERGTHKLAAETDRFRLYQIAPTDKTVKINSRGKPVLILPPYVLGANILGFLPGENRSYAHCYANQGIPTYIRILKDIDKTPALQMMTGDDDALDTRHFCEVIKRTHGKAVTLNGYCQGGFSALCNLLSGELDGLVDAFITCVAPMDGTRSKGLSGFLKRLPERFNDLAYGTKTLPNGNKVADGKLMGWVYKLKSIASEAPIAAFYRDLMMFARQDDAKLNVSKTAAALNYWLNNERNDLPLEITKMSFASYNTPISDDGTLPIKLFGRKLNLRRLADKKIPWLICYGEHDDLVEKPTALAPVDYVPVEVTPFPKGHVAIATSWSDPTSKCALHTRFGEGNWRGPVRFQLDLDKPKASKPKAAKRKAAKKKTKKKPAVKKTKS